MERHVCLWDRQGPPQPLTEIEPDRPDNRLNEGAVGPDGAFWVGTMLNNINDGDIPRGVPKATGSIYRCPPDFRVVHVTDDLFGITNTLVFPRPGPLLTADTLANTIYDCQTGADGRLQGRKTLPRDFRVACPTVPAWTPRADCGRPAWQAVRA
jgi:sugar lactone lactonase YvrE